MEPTSRTQVKRLAKRGRYDQETIYRILDEGFVCHVGFVQDDAPVVIPTGYARLGDRLYIHGSAASRMLRTLDQGVPICVTVTLVDGLVFARSAFHHSINYRSAVIFGTAMAVTDESEKMEALRLFTEHMIPGRWSEIRGPNGQELKATLVLSLPIEEASAKVRTGPPVDDEPDYSLPVWAGVLPLKLTPGTPENDPRLPAEILPGESALDWRRRGKV